MDRHRGLGRRLEHIGGTRSGEAINHIATSRGCPSRQHSRADHLGRRRIGYTEDASPCLRPFADFPGDDRGVDDLRARDAWWQCEQRWSSDEASIQVTTEEEPWQLDCGGRGRRSCVSTSTCSGSGRRRQRDRTMATARCFVAGLALKRYLVEVGVCGPCLCGMCIGWPVPSSLRSPPLVWDSSERDADSGDSDASLCQPWEALPSCTSLCTEGVAVPDAHAHFPADRLSQVGARLLEHMLTRGDLVCPDAGIVVVPCGSAAACRAPLVGLVTATRATHAASVAWHQCVQEPLDFDSLCALSAASRASHRTWAPRLLRLQHRVQHRDDHLHGQLQGSCDTVPTSASVPCGSRSPRAPVSRPCVVGLPRSCSVSRAVWTGVRT